MPDQHTEEVVLRLEQEMATALKAGIESIEAHFKHLRPEERALLNAINVALSSPSLDEREREREIWINRGRFVVRGEAMQGDALRNIPTPPISANDDLFQVTVRSREPDLLVRPDRLVDFKAGVEFFSAPKTIQAGND